MLLPRALPFLLVLCLAAAAAAAARAAVAAVPAPDDDEERVEGEEIDYSTCGKDAVCGVRASCLEEPDPGSTTGKKPVNTWKEEAKYPQGRATLVFLKPGPAFEAEKITVSPTCTVGVWIKPLSAKEWVVKMQVMSDPGCIKERNCNDENKRMRIDPVKGMVLNHTGHTLFGCRKADNGSVVALGKDVEMYALQKSRLKPEDCYCSFLVKNAGNIERMGKGETFMEFALTTGIYDTENSNGFDDISTYRRCNVFNANASLHMTTNGIIKSPINDLLSSDLYCGSRQYAKLYAGLPGQEPEPVDSVTCVEVDNAGTKEWVYQIQVMGLPTTTKTVEKDKDFPAFCAVPVNTVCEKIDYKGTPAPVFDTEPTTGKITISCASKFYLVNRTNYTEHAPECKNNPEKGNEAAWIVTINSVVFVVTHVECTGDRRCKHSTYYHPNCPERFKDVKDVENPPCKKVMETDGLRCEDEYQLTVIQKNGEKFLPEFILCNIEEGLWKNGENETELYDKGANIYCEKNKKPSDALTEEEKDVYNTISYIAIGIVALLVFFVIAKFILGGVRT